MEIGWYLREQAAQGLEGLKLQLMSVPNRFLRKEKLWAVASGQETIVLLVMSTMEYLLFSPMLQSGVNRKRDGPPGQLRISRHGVKVLTIGADDAII